MDNLKTPRINVFKNKNFVLLFGGVLVSNIAHILFNFVMSLYVLRIAKSAYGADMAPLIQGYYLLLAGLILLILMPFGGALADRLNKVRTMYITDFIRGFTILSICALLFFTDDPKLKIVYIFIMAFILGINSAFFNPASASLLRFIVDDDEIQQASSYLQGSMNLQNIAGLILGGILFAMFGIYVIFIINGIAYIVSAITEMFISYNAEKAVEKTTLKNVLTDIVAGVKYVYNFRAIFVLLVMALFLNFFIAPIFQNAIPYFVEFGLVNETNYLFIEYLTAENWYSIILIASSVSGIIMSIILSRRRPKERYSKDIIRNLIIFVIITILGSIVMILYHLHYFNVNIVLVGMTLLMFIMGFANVAFNVPVSVIIQKKVDINQLGKVQSVMGVLSQALIPLSGLIAGLLISKVSIVSLYIFSSIGMISIIVWYVSNKHSREL